MSGGLLTLASTILYFRPRLKEAKAGASKAETESSAAQYSHLMERSRTQEELCKKQGIVIVELRQDLLKLGEEKYESDQRVMALEKENERLMKRIDELATDVEAYRHIAESKR